MRPYSEKEKSIVRSLLDSDQQVYSLIDFVKFYWPGGHFEISTFQQAVRLHLEDEKEKEPAMAHLLDILSLIKYLEYRGYVSSWDAFPMEDNTATCGEKTSAQKPYFLPDISVAGDLLKYGNKKFTFSNGLTSLVKRNFRSVAATRHRQLVRTLVAGFIILGSIGLASIYTNYLMIEDGVNINLGKLKAGNTEVLENQRLNKIIIDSLRQQNQRLIRMTNQVSRNTENTRQIETEVKQQNNRLQWIINHQAQTKDRLETQLEVNRRYLQKTDSLLQAISTNEPI